MESNLDAWMQVYRNIRLEATDRLKTKLFLTEFDDAAIGVKGHITNGCLLDPLIDGKHYIETTDGKFPLLRGTGRDESCHRRLNNVWPDRDGEELGANMK